MSGIAFDIVQKFQQKNLLFQHLAAFTGFFVGLKTYDYFFFDQTKFDILKENLEDEYWAKNGEPKIIKPYLVQSLQNEEIRKSWIYIMYDKDKIITRKEDIDY